MWHILEHIALALSIALNLYVIACLAISYGPTIMEELNKPAFPNLASDSKKSMAEAWTDGQKDPWTASIRQLNSSIPLPKEHTLNVPLPNVRQDSD